MGESGMSAPHDFDECLAFSHAAEALPFWRTCYDQWFPGHVACTSHRADGQYQRLGVDRSVVLATGKQVFIDEKVRRRNRKTGKVYQDIAIEFISNTRTGAPGWACKALITDFIAYAIAPLGIAHLLPVLQLQQAWQRHGEEWKRQFKRVEAENGSYLTISVAVPPRVLFGAMCGIHYAKFEPIELTEAA
jgi:hypothetical protein